MGKDAWIIAVKESLCEDPRPAKSNENIIHSVPKSLFNRNAGVFYIPQVMSIGPYHFKRKLDVRRDDMESLKSEVSRKFRNILIARGYDGFNLVIDKFKGEEIHKVIKGSYVKEFRISREAWVWMVARDACFLLEILHRFSEDYKDEEESAMPRIDSILSRKRHHPLLNDIVKDMFKMENQLPFWILQEIKSLLKPVTISESDRVQVGKDNWFESALKNLSPIEVDPVPNRTYKENHILQLLHDYIVDKPILDHSKPIKQKPPLLPFMVSPLSLIWKAVVCVLILFLFPLFIIWLIWHWLRYCKSYIYIERRGSVPTAEELKRVGVRFKSLGNRGIYHIKFKTSNSTLYVPKFNVDDRTEVMLRNLMALEICSEQEEKPVTRYVILMNDLINTSTDVAILRKEEILTHKLGSDDEVAQLWNSIIVSSSTTVPYTCIDFTASEINRYTKKWWRVLWAQFQMAHCSKPWLVISLLGGISLLLLTLVQVFCLFQSCLLR